MADEHAGFQESLSDPADSHVLITPNDSTDLATIPRGLFFNGAGDVVLRDKSGNDETYTVTAGQLLPFRARRILATGTTATGIIAMW